MSSDRPATEVSSNRLPGFSCCRHLSFPNSSCHFHPAGWTKRIGLPPPCLMFGRTAEQRHPSSSAAAIQRSADPPARGGRTALTFTASGRSPLGMMECADRCQITSASSRERPGVMFKGNPLRSTMAHLALRGASHCETDGKTVGLREAPRRLRGGCSSSTGAE